MAGSSSEIERSVRLEVGITDGPLHELLARALPAAVERLAAAGLTLAIRPGDGPDTSPLIRLLDLRSECSGSSIPFIGTVIAVTATAEAALAAIRQGATDALPVPFEAERLRAALEAAAFQAVVRTSGGARASAPIVIRTKGRTYAIRPDDLFWVEARAPFVTLHTTSGTIRIRTRLQHIERLLDPTVFARVHRSVVVRRDQITQMVSRDRGDFDLVLRTGAVTRLARRRAGSFQHLTGHV